MGSFLKLKKILEEKESFVLVCHIDPDGDAVGSMVGLALALENKGKEVTLVCSDKIPEVFRFIEQGKTVNNLDLSKADAILLLDNGDGKRTGFLSDLINIKGNIPIVNIDHHPKNDLWKISTINYADPDFSSASEAVYRILIGLGYTITPDIATALLLGIFTDTGGFKHPNTKDDVLNIVSKLLSSGARLKKIASNIENSHPVSMFKLWGIALSRLVINKDYKLSVSVLTQKDLVKAEAGEEEISGLVNLLNSAPESEAALLLYEAKDGKIKGSLRTESDKIDLSELAKLLGGGGHKRAAGFTISGRIEIEDDKWRII